MSELEEFETDRLVFSPDGDDPSVWWAVDEDNIEYCVRPSLYDPDQWTATAQKRVAYDSISEGLGTFYDFEEACWVCDQTDTANILDTF